jgi:chromosome segregation ATPase
LERIAVNCPKCGFEQEERLDCKKCGIVFSKYTALHYAETTQNTEDTGQVPAREMPEGSSDYGLAELRKTLKDLDRCLSEIEFEKAQRQQLRAEMKNLEQKFREELAKLISRVDEAEKLRNERELLQEQKIWPEIKCDQLLQRVGALEVCSENWTRSLDALKEELAGLKARDAEGDREASDVLAAVDLKCQEMALPLAQLGQDVARTEILCRSLETDLRKIQEAAEAIRHQHAQLKLDHLELSAKIGNMELKLDSVCSEFGSRISERGEDQKIAIEQNVQFILESLDNLRCSVANLAPKP